MKGLIKIFMLVIACVIIGIVLMYVYVILASAYNNRDRMSEEELLSAAGIINGQVNELRLGDVLLRFPENYRFTTVGARYSSGVVAAVISNEGVVSGLKLRMDLPTRLNLPLIVKKFHTRIRVEISERKYKPDYSAQQIKRLEKEPWASQRDIPEWGLREYISVDFPEHTAWGVLKYRTLQETSSKGGHVIYSCGANSGAAKKNVAKASQCAAGYRIPAGLSVGYFINGPLLPHWKAVDTAVFNFVNSFIVEE